VESCRAGGESNQAPEVFGVPASATFSGPGNQPPASPGPKTETKAQKLTKALAQCHKDRSKKKRTKCEATAKKKYGPAKKSKKAKKTNRRTGR
jgi:hypothetical protein